MKTRRIFFIAAASIVALLFIGFLLSCGKEDAKVPNSKEVHLASARTVEVVTYSYEYVDNHLVLFKHTNDIIKEYFLIQREDAPLTTPLQNISNVTIENGGTKITIDYGSQQQLSFSTQPNTLNALWCAGIANHVDEAGFSKAIVKDNILSYGQGPSGGGTGGGAGKRCKDCLDGGCGSTSCSRSIEVMGVKKSCTTSCEAGYHACCGDLVNTGCFCQKNICCK